jgi:23S rRNA pseudouridine2605 synthase
MIVAGRVLVNGRRAQLGRRVDISKDTVEVDGSIVELRVDQVTYLLNKPPGVVATSSDPQGRTTVLDLVDVEHRVFPVGRLDIETEGAILLTNDGDLALRLTHPRYGIPKTYLAQVEGSVGKRTLTRLEAGIELEDGMTNPAAARVLERAPASTLVELIITEGRNRQVRRMLEAVHHPVIRLVRTTIGNLQLGHLKAGTFRRLSPVEVGTLYSATEGPGEEPTSRQIDKETR